MKQSEQYYSKESFSEKLRQHVTDILIISVCLPFVFLMAKYKCAEQTSEPIQVTQQVQSDIKQQSIINLTDTINQKSR